MRGALSKRDEATPEGHQSPTGQVGNRLKGLVGTMERHMPKTNDSKVAYFSMEIALEPAIPTYSGGLGVLAGDYLRSAADLGVPIVAVTLIHRKGYFRQRLDAQGNQFEEDAVWSPEKLLEDTGARTAVEIEGRQVQVRAWRYAIRGISGHEVSVFCSTPT